VLAPLIALFFERRPAAYACFLPAVFHTIWVRAQGTDSILKGMAWRDALAAFADRMSALVGEIPVVLSSPGYTRARALVWAGIAALAVAVALWPVAAASRRTAALALGAGATGVVFALVSISILPEDARWFAHTALDRLLLHPSALFLAAAFLLLSERQ
jgi:hypothetical protein